MKIILSSRLLSLALISFFIALPLNAQTNPFAPDQTTVARATENNLTENVSNRALEITLRDASRNSFEKLAAAPKSQNKQDDQAKSQTPAPFKYERPSTTERAKKFADRIVGPYTLIGVAAGSAFAQINDAPEDWENNFKGYARRFGSAFGENAIEQTVVFGLDEAFKVDSLFYKKGKGTKLSARIANALLTTVTARTPSGRRIPGFSRIAGVYASNLISTTTWYPDRFSYQDGLRQGTISLGFNAGFNLLREFVFPGRRK